MNNSHVLIIVNTIYQLLSAINIKETIAKTFEVDLILTDVTIQLKHYKSRLVESGLFKQVIYASIFDLNKKYQAGKEPELTEAFRNANAILGFKLDVQLSKYSKVYFSNFDFFSRLLAYHFYYDDCNFYCYEDGFSSYVIDFLRPDRAEINKNADAVKIKEKVKGIYLYEPHLAMRNDFLPNVQLPKISKDNKELIGLLNYIFGYKKAENHWKYIFLEQSFRAEGIKSNDIELMKLCSEAVGTNEFIVKPHPRNTHNIAFELGISRKYFDDTPWELFLLNEDMTERTVITVCSNGALTSKLLFDMHINTVMLYELFLGKVLWKEDDILKKYLYKFQKQFSGNSYYIPQTIYELQSILRYLGGHHGEY